MEKIKRVVKVIIDFAKFRANDQDDLCFIEDMQMQFKETLTELEAARAAWEKERDNFAIQFARWLDHTGGDLKALPGNIEMFKEFLNEQED